VKAYISDKRKSHNIEGRWQSALRGARRATPQKCWIEYTWGKWGWNNKEVLDKEGEEAFRKAFEKEWEIVSVAKHSL